MKYYIFSMLQIRALHIMTAFTLLLIIVLVLRGIYRLFHGANPYIYSGLWLLCTLALFAGKCRIFEGVVSYTFDKTVFMLSQENVVVPVSYWVIAGVLFLISMIRKGHLINKVRHYLDAPIPCEIAHTSIKVSSLLVSPFTLGIFHHYIVLPVDYETRFTREELAMAICHEQMHIKCHHTALFRLVSLVRSLCWLNPLVYAACHAFRSDMEILCDNKVAENYTVPLYGALILKSLEFPVGDSRLCRVNFFFSSSDCKRRIHVLGRSRRAFSMNRKKILYGFFGIALVGVASLLLTSRWINPDSKGVRYVEFVDDGQSTYFLNDSQQRNIIHDENDKEIVLDLMLLKQIAKRNASKSGTAYVALADYRYCSNSRRVINLYSSSSRYIHIAKRLGNYGLVARIL